MSITDVNTYSECTNTTIAIKTNINAFAFAINCLILTQPSTHKPPLELYKGLLIVTQAHKLTMNYSGHTSTHKSQQVSKHNHIEALSTALRCNYIQTIWR